jgi:putative spermidine/putrescine transport system permease protein
LQLVTAQTIHLDRESRVQRLAARWSDGIGLTSRRLLLLPIVAFLFAFFVAPLVWGVVMSLQGAGAFGAYYAKIITDTYYLKVLVNTFLLGVGVTVICVLVGYPCGYFIARSNSRFRRWVVLAVLTPLLVSIVMRSFGWIALLGRQGVLNSFLAAVGAPGPWELLNAWPGVVIALVHVFLPYMILAVASVIGGIPAELEQAAETLGASRWRTFLRVTLPLSLDGVGTGAILVFMLTIGGFVTILLIGGDHTMTLPLLMYQQVGTVGNFGFAAALGNVLLVTALGVLYLQTRYIRTRGRA